MAKYLIPMLLGIMMIWSCDDEWFGNKKIKSLSIITTVFNPDSNSIDSTKLLYKYDRQGKKVHFAKYHGEPNGVLYLNSSEEYSYGLSGDLNEVIRLDKEKSPYIAVSYKYDFGNNIKIEHWSESGELTAEIFKQFNKRDQLISKFIRSFIDSSETLAIYQYDDQEHKTYYSIYTDNWSGDYPDFDEIERTEYDIDGNIIHQAIKSSVMGNVDFLFKYDTTAEGILRWVKKTTDGNSILSNHKTDGNWLYWDLTKYNLEGKILIKTTYADEVRKGIKELKFVEDTTKNNVDAKVGSESMSTEDRISKIADDLMSRSYWVSYPDSNVVKHIRSTVSRYKYDETGYTRIDSSFHSDRKIEKTTYDKSNRPLLVVKKENYLDLYNHDKDGWPTWINNMVTKTEYNREYY